MAQHAVSNPSKNAVKITETNYAIIYRTSIAQKKSLILKTARKASRDFNDIIKREYQILSGFKHPHIVRVLDFDVDPEGRAYFTAEYVDGKPIDQCFKGFSAGFASAVLQVTDALAAIHNKGFIHQDLNPHNILYDQNQKKITLIDFGFTIASSARDQKAGTIGYLAPEILKDIGPDQRSDIYSLGVIIHEILTGSRPKRQPKPMTAVPGDIADMIGRMLMPEPHLRPSLPELFRCLDKYAVKETGAPPAYKVELPIPAYIENDKINTRVSAENNIPFIISGTTGAGKTRHLKEIKYRLMSKGWRVLLHAGKGNISFLDALRDFLDMKDIFRFQNRVQVYETVREAVASGAIEKGIGILVDDLDECSDFELGLFRYIGLGARSGNLLVAAAACSVERNSLERISRLGLDTIDLDPFSRSGIEKLLDRTFFKIEITPPDLGLTGFARVLESNTGGNPHFLIEVLKMLSEKKIISFQENKWRVDMRMLKQVDMPTKVENTLAARIKGLSKSAIGLLKILAVCDCPLSASMIGELAPDRGGIDIEVLRNNGLVCFNETARGIFIAASNRILLNIVRDLIQPAEYQELAERSIAAMGSWDSVPAWQMAPLGILFESIGKTAEAIKCYKTAAETAEKTFDHDSALMNYQRLIDLSKTGPAELHHSFLVRSGELFEITGDSERAATEFERALGSTEKTVLARAYAGMAKARHSRGKTADAIDFFDRALTLMAPGSAEHTSTANYMAYALVHASDFTAAQKILDRSLDSARRLMDRELEAETSYYLATIDWYQSRYEECTAKTLELLGFCEKYDLDKQHAFAANLLGMLYMMQLDLARAEFYAETALQGFRKIKQTDAMATAWLTKGQIMAEKGEIKTAQAEFEEILKTESLLQNTSIRKTTLANLCSINRQMGSFDKALHYAQKLSDIVPFDPHAACEAGCVHCMKGELETARSLLERTLERCQNNLLHMNLAFVYHALGNANKTNEEFDKAMILSETAVIEPHDKIELHLRASELSCLKGDYTRARDLVVQASAWVPAHSIYDAITRIHKDVISWILDSELDRDFSRDLAALKEKGYTFIYAFLKRLICQALLNKTLGTEKIETVLNDLYEIENIYAAAGAILEIRRVQELKERLFPILVREYSSRSVSQKYLDTLGGIADLVHTRLGEKDFSTRVLDLVIRATGAERGAIFVRSGDKMELAAGRDLDKATIKDAGNLSQTVINDTAEHEFVFIQDAAGDARYNIRKSVIINHIRAILCIPLSIDNKILGAVYLDSRLANALFSSQDRDFLVTVTRILASVMEKSILLQSREEENILLKSRIIAEIGHGYLLGRSPQMTRIYRQIEDIGASKAPVLLLGETGTGKGMIARYIHMHSRQRHNRFLTINCGTIPETLLESELFGHKKGAFTGAVSDKKGLLEEAQGGTIFLDEITNTSLAFQAKLLEAIEDKIIRRLGETEQRKIDVRFLFATNKDLEIEVEEGRFRKDLFYRINVFKIQVPPLRERVSDIPLLTRHFLEKYAKEIGKNITGLTVEAMRQLKEHSWAGNVRELQNMIERAVVISKGPLITAENLGLAHGRYSIAKMSDIKKEAVIEAMNAANGNATKAAEILQISRKTITRYLKKFNIRGQ